MLDDLPNKKGLVNLIMRQEGTGEGKHVMNLKKTSISVLYKLALASSMDADFVTPAEKTR